MTTEPICDRSFGPSLARIHGGRTRDPGVGALRYRGGEDGLASGDVVRHGAFLLWQRMEEGLRRFCDPLERAVAHENVKY